ncbi:DNA translocase FtsK [Streptomyces misionensis]|uniref:DNA translocase FtsK n=1 Tax=Streptomyces misionensis TaxID=67331 RepID=UPI0009449367|nr:DNA translocase FtsK [Streptomyces misionensis]
MNTETEADRALRLIASRNLAATSALQRWMNITFARANDLLDELHQQGWVGPADGSAARTVHAQYCQQCGRIGRRGFRTHTNDEQQISITVCANKTACRKRWPNPPRDEA